MSNKKLLIDATHCEETRVAVVDENYLLEFDYENKLRKQLKGNIFLAKVTRVEPSLQAAFVDYGGNRHGFLPFSEIHPDYFRIPVEDREALQAELAEEAERRRIQEEEREAAEEAREAAREKNNRDNGEGEDDDSEDDDTAPSLDNDDLDEDDAQQDNTARDVNDMDQDGDDDEDDDSEDDEDESISISGEFDVADDEEAEEDAGADIEIDADADSDAESDEQSQSDNQAEGDDAQDGRRRGRGRRRGGRGGRGGNGRGGRRHAAARSKSVEMIGGEDDGDAVYRPNLRKKYKIQEVIKRGQIMLIQVSKEERGNKGAAVTTYLSLAGRYCVLMPNSPRAGGVSRKVPFKDRKKLKTTLNELNVSDGMSVILRTAGVGRTKTEIKRDYDYLTRLWENIREQTLQSSAPAKIHEEADLIKRSIRDLYTRDIDDIYVAGKDGYKEAKDFMKMMIPSHSKKVKLYEDEKIPLFHRYQIESQIAAIGEPVAPMKSGGYLVINPTEALVSIDVNSGRATKERHIEETALNTNLEAADEVARQLRLRDLGGLVVIDFIDMEDHRNNRRVQNRMRDALSQDRARIQIGKISNFGLMELSRQRLNPSLTEAQFQPCETCKGIGVIRTMESAALNMLRKLEEEGIRGRSNRVSIEIPNEMALYLLNNKRENLAEIEMRYGMAVSIRVDDTLASGQYKIMPLKNETAIDVSDENDESSSQRGRNDRDRSNRSDRDRSGRSNNRHRQQDQDNDVDQDDTETSDQDDNRNENRNDRNDRNDNRGEGRNNRRGNRRGNRGERGEGRGERGEGRGEGRGNGRNNDRSRNNRKDYQDNQSHDDATPAESDDIAADLSVENSENIASQDAKTDAAKSDKATSASPKPASKRGGSSRKKADDDKATSQDASSDDTKPAEAKSTAKKAPAKKASGTKDSAAKQSANDDATPARQKSHPDENITILSDKDKDAAKKPSRKGWWNRLIES